MKGGGIGVTQEIFQQQVSSDSWAIFAQGIGKLYMSFFFCFPFYKQTVAIKLAKVKCGLLRISKAKFALLKGSDSAKQIGFSSAEQVLRRLQWCKLPKRHSIRAHWHMVGQKGVERCSTDIFSFQTLSPLPRLSKVEKLKTALVILVFNTLSSRNSKEI